MSISLSKNQTISLAKSGSGLRKVFMGLGWDPVKSGGLFGFLGGGSESIDLDASVLVYDANKRLLTTVYFRELSAYNGAIEHGGDNLTGDGDGDDERIYIDLSRLPAEAVTLVFTVNSFRGQTFDKVANASCRLVDNQPGEKEIANISLSSQGQHTGMIMAKLHKTGSDWEMTMLAVPGQGRTLNDMKSQIVALI